VKALHAAGAEMIFRETASGAHPHRAQPRQAVTGLNKDDVLVVKRLDQIAHSTHEFLNTAAGIADNSVTFRFLGNGKADTATPHGCLILTVLGGLAEFERELIRACTIEGWESATARGMKLGPKPKCTDGQKHEAIKHRDVGESVREADSTLKVSHSTISKPVSTKFVTLRDQIGGS
jgi:DNA invertase Pin-like site-specific DNA recombinase